MSESYFSDDEDSPTITGSPTNKTVQNSISETLLEQWWREKYLNYNIANESPFIIKNPANLQPTDKYYVPPEFRKLILQCRNRSRVWFGFQAKQRKLNTIQYDILSNEVIESILPLQQSYAELSELIDWSDETTLYMVRYAIETNDHQWLRLMIEHGADITEIDQINLLRLSHHPHGRITDSNHAYMLMVQYLIEILDINVNYIAYNVYDPNWTNDHTPLLINDTVLLTYLHAHCGNVLDFCSHNHERLRIWLVYNSNLINFLNTMYENDVIAISNELMISKILSPSFKCLNQAEMMYKSARRQRHIYASASSSGGTKNMIQLVAQSLQSYVGHMTVRELYMIADLVANMLHYYLNNESLFASNNTFESWFFGKKNDLYWSVKSIAAIFLRYLSLCGHVDGIKAVFDIFRKHIGQAAGVTEDERLKRAWWGMVTFTTRYVGHVSVLQYLLNDVGIDVNKYPLTRISHVVERYRDSVRVKYELSLSLLESIVYNVQLHGNEIYAIQCIQYLFEYASKELLVIEDRYARLLNYCATKWYKVFDALLKWCYGYDILLDPVNYSMVYPCSNILEPRIRYQNQLYNPLVYLITHRKYFDYEFNSDSSMYAFEECHAKNVSVTMLLFHLLDRPEVNINVAIDDDGNSLLHHAIMRGSLIMALELIEKSYAKVNTLNKAGISPLALAQQMESTYRSNRDTVRMNKVKVFLNKLSN